VPSARIEVVSVELDREPVRLEQAQQEGLLDGTRSDEIGRDQR
jgi:hypothetical protein